MFLMLLGAKIEYWGLALVMGNINHALKRWATLANIIPFVPYITEVKYYRGQILRRSDTVWQC